MAQKTIKFFKNHNNKFKCHYFTTVRPGWFKGYYSKGENYAIMLNGVFEFEAQIIEVKPFLLKNVNPFMSFIDAAITPTQFQVMMTSMYPQNDLDTEQLLFILLKRID